MTPHEYITQMDRLLRSGCDEQALEFATRFGAEIMSRLSAEEFFRVSAALEGADLAVSATDARPSAADSDARQAARSTA